MATKKHKYNAKAIITDGIKFPSKAEADYYHDLKRLNKLSEVKMQSKFTLLPKFEKGEDKYRGIDYVADYFFYGSGKVIDIKGFETPVFKIKQKLFNFYFKDCELITLAKCPKWLMNELRTDVRWIETGRLKKLRKLKGSNKKFDKEINCCYHDVSINAII